MEGALIWMIGIWGIIAAVMIGLGAREYEVTSRSDPGATSWTPWWIAEGQDSDEANTKGEAQDGSSSRAYSQPEDAGLGSREPEADRAGADKAPRQGQGNEGRRRDDRDDDPGLHP